MLIRSATPVANSNSLEAHSVTVRETQSAIYWDASFTIEDADLDFLYNLLLEDETPLSGAEMAQAIVRRRIEREQQARKRREQGAAVYLPKETYAIGQTLFFPALEYASGAVAALRSGFNPEQGEFDVLTLDFGDGVQREFAARLATHKLNTQSEEKAADEMHAPEVVFAEHGASITAKLEARLHASPDIVRLAGRWFPRALLATVNIGHLNLAEAVLDMAGGGPLPTDELLKEVGLPTNVNPRLQAFSLNYALQEDERFDEVGPAGQVLWYLRRLEPAEVLTPARRLENAAPDYDRARLPEVLLNLEREIEDEYSPAPDGVLEGDDVDLYLTFPHRRAGTLPLSPRLARLFPTALITPRVRFVFVDGDTGEKFPGWVVRPGHYVYGLEEWYKRYDFPVGGHLTVRRGDQPDEVIVKADKRRPTREWIRTAAPGPDGRLAFSMQKKQVAVAYDELMVVAVDNFAAVDDAWAKGQAAPFEKLVANIFREIAKLNPQSTVHAKTLYAAVNVARRCPPGPLFALLVTHPYYSHVGDAYWRFDLSHWTE
jgi:hypothetical protein